MNRKPLKADFQQSFTRRQKDNVQKPRGQTDLSFAAHLAEKASRKYDRPFSSKLKVIP